MQLQSYKKQFTVAKPSKGEPRNAHQAVLNEAMEFVGWSIRDKRKLGMMLRRMKGKRPNQILDMKKQSLKGTNPQALFLWMLKQ